MVLEAVCDYELLVSHAFFGMPGTANDKTICLYSPLMDMYLKGTMPVMDFFLAGILFCLPFMLADGIYPDCPFFAKTIAYPRNQKESSYAKKQESARKDVERLFGVLLKVFKILKVPALCRTVEQMRVIVTCCLILHNFNMVDRLNRSQGLAEYRAELRSRFKSVVTKEKKSKKKGRSAERELVSVPHGSVNTRFQSCGWGTLFNSAEYLKLRDAIVDHWWQSN